jgi:hypothetical protein
MLEADKLLFNEKYRTALVSAFVRRGILSLEAVARMSSRFVPSMVAKRAISVPERKVFPELPQVALSAVNYGLRSKTLLVSVPGEAKRPLTGTTASPSAEEKFAKSFVDDLFRRGQVDVGEFGDVDVRMVHPTEKHKTHKLIETPKGLMLTRTQFQ